MKNFGKIFVLLETNNIEKLHHFNNEIFSENENFVLCTKEVLNIIKNKYKLKNFKYIVIENNWFDLIIQILNIIEYYKINYWQIYFGLYYNEQFNNNQEKIVYKKIIWNTEFLNNFEILKDTIKHNKCYNLIYLETNIDTLKTFLEEIINNFSLIPYRQINLFVNEIISLVLNKNNFKNLFNKYELK